MTEDAHSLPRQQVADLMSKAGIIAVNVLLSVGSLTLIGVGLLEEFGRLDLLSALPQENRFLGYFAAATLSIIFIATVNNLDPELSPRTSDSGGSEPSEDEEPFEEFSQFWQAVLKIHTGVCEMGYILAIVSLTALVSTFATSIVTPILGAILIVAYPLADLKLAAITPYMSPSNVVALLGLVVLIPVTLSIVGLTVLVGSVYQILSGSKRGIHYALTQLISLLHSSQVDFEPVPADKINRNAR